MNYLIHVGVVRGGILHTTRGLALGFVFTTDGGNHWVGYIGFFSPMLRRIEVRIIVHPTAFKLLVTLQK